MDKTVVELFAGVGGFRCGFNNVKLEDNKVIEEDNLGKSMGTLYQISGCL